MINGRLKVGLSQNRFACGKFPNWSLYPNNQYIHGDGTMYLVSAELSAMRKYHFDYRRIGALLRITITPDIHCVVSCRPVQSKSICVFISGNDVDK